MTQTPPSSIPQQCSGRASGEEPSAGGPSVGGSSARERSAVGPSTGEPKPRVRQTLSQAERIRRRADFERVYQQGLKTPGRYMTVFLLKNGAAVSRLGIAATRKIGGSVVRNRAKRLVRTMYRRYKPGGPALDLVVIPRREFLNVEFASLEAEYQSILSRRASRAPSPTSVARPPRNAR